MQRPFSKANERKIVAAYIRSNIFFPQLRFAFVLALGRTFDLLLLRELDSSSIAQDVTIENIMLAADRIHTRYGVISVLPTKPGRVIDELRKSIEVFDRFIHNVKGQLVPENLSDEAFVSFIRESSLKFWDLSANSWYSESHLKFVSDPGVSGQKLPIRGMSPDAHPSLHSLHAHLNSRCISRLESMFVEHLRDEIIHPFAIMRQGSEPAAR